MDGVLNSVERVVTDGMNQTLTNSYTEEEVTMSPFQMHPLKALGPNGMSPFFFQKYWQIVEHDVTSVILSVLHFGKVSP